ncbi:MAG TPA: hypothetical protein VNK89_09690 [Thermoflexus sp.]|nr:hypothetical protein [Thermoflexus sp.]
MAESKPTLEEWRQLYQAAIRVKEVAPWEWMTETDVFGVQNPETGEVGFVSVMGMRGEHLALAVYLGAEGLYGFWHFREMVESSPTPAPETLFTLLEIPQLQASFEDRTQLSQEDRAVIKQLGLKFRGAQAWPMFRSYRPGFWPWYLEAAEARFLTHVLNQAVEVALRFKEDPALLKPPDDGSYLVRVLRDDGVWEDRIVRVPPPEPTFIPIPMDEEALEAVKQLPHARNTFEMDFFALPGPIREKDKRPYLLYMLLTVDANSGLILAFDFLKPDPDLKTMWGLIPVKVVYQFAKIGKIPRRVTVRSPLLSGLLRLLTAELGFEVKTASVLRRLDQAKAFLWDRLG